MPSSFSYESLSRSLSAQLEQDLTREGKNIVDLILKEADSSIKQSAKQLLELALEEATQNLISGDSLSFDASGNRSFAARFTNLLESLIEKQFNKKEVQSSNRETERSVAENNRLKESLGQRQAALASLAANGQRNL